MVGRPMPPLELSEDEVQQLQALAHSSSLAHPIVQRTQIVLACGASETNTAIAKRMGVKGMTVGKWQKRYRELGLEGLHYELCSGRLRTYWAIPLGALLRSEVVCNAAAGRGPLPW
jgi:putative transposase